MLRLNEKRCKNKQSSTVTKEINKLQQRQQLTKRGTEGVQYKVETAHKLKKVNAKNDRVNAVFLRK